MRQQIRPHGSLMRQTRLRYGKEQRPCLLHSKKRGPQRVLSRRCRLQRLRFCGWVLQGNWMPYLPLWNERLAMVWSGEKLVTRIGAFQGAESFRCNLYSAGHFPVEGREFDAEAFQVSLRVFGGLLFALVDVSHRLGRSDPSLVLHVKHRRLNSLGVVLRE